MKHSNSIFFVQNVSGSDGGSEVGGLKPLVRGANGHIYIGSQNGKTEIIKIKIQSTLENIKNKRDVGKTRYENPLA